MTGYFLKIANIFFYHKQLKQIEGRRCRDRMVVGFTTICEISAYHH